jgi:hypothetical protein
MHVPRQKEKNWGGARRRAEKGARIIICAGNKWTYIAIYIYTHVIHHLNQSISQNSESIHLPSQPCALAQDGGHTPPRSPNWGDRLHEPTPCGTEVACDRADWLHVRRPSWRTRSTQSTPCAARPHVTQLFSVVAQLFYYIVSYFNITNSTILQVWTQPFCHTFSRFFIQSLLE